MRYILLIIQCFVASAMMGQLRFTDPDSIIFWNQDNTNFRLLVETASPSMQAFMHKRTLNPVDLASREKDSSIKVQNFDADNLKEISTEGLTGFELADLFYKVSATLQCRPSASVAQIVENLMYGSMSHVLETTKSEVEKTVVAQAMLNGISTLLATSGPCLYINYYANMSSFIHEDNYSFQLDIMSSFPYDKRIKLRFTRVKPVDGVDLKVYLQLPPGNWTPQTLPIYCNGHDSSYHIENGYAVIKACWQSGFEIYFDYPDISKYANRAD